MANRDYQGLSLADLSTQLTYQLTLILSLASFRGLLIHSDGKRNTPSV